MKKLTLIILIIIFSACKQENKIENPGGIWTESEIEELNSMIMEFDRILTDEYQTYSIKIGYLEYSNYVFENNITPILSGMENLSSDLKKSQVFNKIWRKFNDSYLNEERFELKPKSEYHKYLTHLGKKSEFLNDYTKRFELAEDIQPSVIAGFSKNIKEINLNDKNNRLVFAVHYLTLINR